MVTSSCFYRSLYFKFEDPLAYYNSITFHLFRYYYVIRFLLCLEVLMNVISFLSGQYSYQYCCLKCHYFVRLTYLL